MHCVCPVAVSGGLRASGSQRSGSGQKTHAAAITKLEQTRHEPDQPERTLLLHREYVSDTQSNRHTLTQLMCVHIQQIKGRKNTFGQSV